MRSIQREVVHAPITHNPHRNTYLSRSSWELKTSLATPCVSFLLACKHRHQWRNLKVFSDRLAGWLTDWPTYWSNNSRFTDQPTDWLNNKLTDRLPGSLTDGRTDCLVGWLSDRMNVAPTIVTDRPRGSVDGQWWWMDCFVFFFLSDWRL